MRVLGIDPGPTPGVVLLKCKRGELPHMVQFHGYSMEQLVQLVQGADIVAVERFIVSPGTGRKTRGATPATMAMAHELAEAAKRHGRPLQYAVAGQVKPWATDARLKAWGLYDDTKGKGGHHRDAARHALYAAVKRGALDVLPPK